MNIWCSSIFNIPLINETILSSLESFVFLYLFGEISKGEIDYNVTKRVGGRGIFTMKPGAVVKQPKITF